MGNTKWFVIWKNSFSNRNDWQ